MPDPLGTPAEHDALDHAWDQWLRGETPAERPPLLATVQRLHETDTTPGVSAAFAHRLEEELMVSTTTTFGNDTSILTTSRSIPLPHPGSARLRTRRAWIPVAAAVLLAVTLAAAAAPLRHDDSSPRQVPAPAFVSASPSPPAPGCAIAPRTAPPPPAPAEEVIANPTLRLDNSRLVLSEDALPTGEPAPAEQVVGIERTLAELVACEQLAQGAGGNTRSTLEARARQFALFTDDYLRRHAPPPTALATWDAGATPESAELSWWGPYWNTAGWTAIAMPMVADARQLPGGRVGAVLVHEGGYRDFVVFAPVGGRWLIDEVASMPMIGAPDVATERPPTLAIILADIVFEPSAIGIPPDTTVRLVLVNAGKAVHTFYIDELGIAITVAPGDMTAVDVNAVAGNYTFYCAIPGHREAGMVGTLEVAPAYRLAGMATPTPTPNTPDNLPTIGPRGTTSTPVG